ncbi:hypothetical protein ADEAN_000042700 [Angomonas deanei]|uniref:Uncharacterized protein n=1 Tax=Angomonas deanei TaxID=59799 RepID=A0A7G2C1A8_9TRYP|nr:hypothetical protein ADEAN_000042700 [Angomonas deanei]
MSETVELPVVSIRRAANRIDATYLGTIAIALFPPAYESYPSPVRFSSNSVNDFDRDYVRYYEKRIFSFLKHYDANSLLNYHSTVYDEMVAKGGWKTGLPQYMMDLEEKWGPEKETFGPPPPLQQ